MRYFDLTIFSTMLESFFGKNHLKRTKIKKRRRVESYLKTVGLHKDFSGHNGYKFYNKGFSCHDFITRTSKAVMDSGIYFDCLKQEKMVIIYNLYFHQTQKLNQILIFIFTISALKKNQNSFA